ncbi:reverse transcriptase domain-containing protein, partial [Tanacetum coccineum]
MVKDLLTNKEKLLELANIPLNENCSAVLLKKLPEKLRDTGRFLIPCDFYGLESCMALADLGASINLMTLSVWKTLSLPDLSTTQMTLELATRTIAYPAGIAEDVFVQVEKFTFLADFVVVDPRVPLISGRPFLRTTHALVDVHGKKLTLQFGDEELVFNVENSDFLLEETDAFLSLDDSIPLGIDNGIYDSEGDILFLEELLNEDPTPNLPPIPHPVCLINETEKIKSSIDDPPDIKLKDLPPHLEFSGYFEIPIDPQDQDKTTLTCPYGTFAYRRMPFGLFNAPGTFQRCMVAIFHDMIEKTMEVFMDDFSVFGDSFSLCLSHLDMMLKWCKDTNLVLNWEKCHFMVKEGIVLGHKISKSGIEVDRAKVDVILKLPPLTTVKGIRSFLAPILVSPDYDLPFELMFYVSDYAVGAVLGQRKDKYFRPIHYASKTLSDAQINYTITEKELLAVVYAFEKFRSYLVLSKTIVYTDHSALKYLFNKQDAKPRLLWWILLLQEFTIEIHDKKRAENLAAGHLSILENPYQGDRVGIEINDNFPHESLNMISLNPDNEPPWFTDIANYLIIRRCVDGQEAMDILQACHNGPPGDTKARTTPRKNSLTLVFSGPPFIAMPRTLSRIVTRVSIRERSHSETKCPKILF